MLYGDDTAIAVGSTDDEFKLRSGMEFSLQSRWTASMVKEDGKRLVNAFHVSADVFDNGVSRLMLWWKSLWVGVIAAGIGALCGALIMSRFRTELIPTESTGTAQENGRLICDWLANRKGESIILASLSKGGTDVRMAMLQSGANDRFRNVIGWINVGGILYGSPMASWILNRSIQTITYRILFRWFRLRFQFRTSLERRNGGDLDVDLIGMTVITGTAPRGYELSAHFRQKGIRVVLGGPHVTLVPEDAQPHADSIVVGYAEEEWPRLLRDYIAGTLHPRYTQSPNLDLAGYPRPRRSVLPPAPLSDVACFRGDARVCPQLLVLCRAKCMGTQTVSKACRRDHR